MQTIVTFRSTAFPPEPGEEDEINPGVWGRRLATHLADTLASHGLTPGEPSPEDWGWYLPVAVDGVRLALCCGHQDGEDDEFLCFTEPDTPVVRRLFRTTDLTVQLGRLVAAVDAVLAAHPDVNDVVWRSP